MGRKLVEAKDVAVLTKSIVKSVWDKYTYPYHLGGYDISITIPRRTEVTDEARAYAREKNVKIVRLRY